MIFKDCMKNFNDLNLSDNVLQALHKKGFEAPSPVQELVIPLLMNTDHDIIGQAQTGTGKTAAFGIPLIEQLSETSRYVSALVMTPTRELAIQVAEEIHSLKGWKKLRVLPVYGGQSIVQQQNHLKKGIHIVVGTPGRLLDLIRRKSLNLDRITHCILDEADEMLNMGFLEDVETILREMPENRRMLLFSATMPQDIRRIADTFMKDSQTIRVRGCETTVAQTDQIYFEVSNADKFEAMCRIIDIEPEFYGLIFCRTKVDVDTITGRMVDRGYDVDGLHGDLSQMQREKIMDKFKRRHINILVATDVAARGLDVQDLTHVINYAIPNDPEAYIHRIGRTGRAGKEGTAVTFVTPAESQKLKFIQRKVKTKIREDKLPKIREVIRAKKLRILKEVEELIASGSFDAYTGMAQKLLESYSPEQALAALFMHAYQHELDRSQYSEIRGGQEKIDGQTRLFIARGRKDGMTPKKLINFIMKNVSVNPAEIQDISIQEDFSFMTAPFKVAEKILRAFRGGRGKRPMVTKAKGKK
ncbi:DEAD/DEAH box helicase [bacterium]|nr:DEAD/DEAH box helicase [bacterium]